MSEVKLGYVGLGNMGAPTAKRLIDWPGGLLVFDVCEEPMNRLGEAVNVELPLAKAARRTLAGGLGVPHTESK